MIYCVKIRTCSSFNPYRPVFCDHLDLRDNWSCVWRFRDAFGLSRDLVARSAIYQGV